MKRLILPLLAIGIGTAVTLLAVAGSYVAFHAGAESIGEILLWPNTLLQNLVPIVYGLPNIGTPDHPLYEGTPVNILAFFISFPLAIPVYSIVAYVFLRWRRRALQMTHQT
jgi:hypothetical protein